MNFNMNPLTSSYTISKTVKANFHVLPATTSHDENTALTSSNNPGHKFNIGKHLPFKIVLPATSKNQSTGILADVAHMHRLPNGYSYLYFTEINPPPPKVC